jgi:putative transposase
MPRLPRYAASGMPQHVIQRGNNRSVLFVAESDYRFFRDCLIAACARYECEVHAYVFMTNHVHMLMTPRTSGGISRVLQAVGRRYVRCFNTAYRRTGTLWEGRYRATVVESDQYLFACYRYIELNPVRAGLATAPAAYRWSSHRANALGRRDPLVTPHESYRALGSDASVQRDAYRALFAMPLDDAVIAAIRDSTNRGWALGGKRFRDEIATLLGRRVEPAIRGRRPRQRDVI